MNKRLRLDDSNETSKIEKQSKIINEIFSKSNNIKARLKSKYILYKLERDFFHKKYE